MSRLLTALVAVPILLVIILAGPSWLFLALGLGSAVASYRELSELSQRVGWKLLPAGYAGVCFVVLAFYPGFFGLEPVALGVIVFYGLAAVTTRTPSPETLGAVTATLFGTVYIGAALGSVVGLRVVEPDRDGRLWIVFLLSVVFIGDAAAYYFGRLTGRRALAPVLSPKKTVEGLIGGVAGSMVTAIALGETVLPSLGWQRSLGLGLLMAVLGVGGDLFESLLKRSANAKDTSSLFPGHGGMLDRIDSVLFAAPALYLYVKWASG